MNKIDPKLFAIGTGAVLGANTMSIDNDPIGLATGAAIGAGTAAMMNIETPNNLDFLSHKGINNVRKQIDLTATTGRAQTFNELKTQVLSLAAGVVKNSKSTSTSFNIEAPYSSLNKGTYDDFTRYVNNAVSEESLREIRFALEQKNDDIFIANTKLDPNMDKDIITKRKAKEGAHIKYKINHLKAELRRLGFKGPDVDEKLAKLMPILEMDKVMQIGDGIIDVDGLGKIQITSTIGVGDDKALVHFNNRNMYDVKSANLFGSSILKGKDSSAVAQALGLAVADMFNLQEQVLLGKGMAPDDAVAMMVKSGKLSDSQLQDLVTKLGANYNYNEQGSGQVKQAVKQGLSLGSIKPNSYSIGQSALIEYGTTLDFLDDWSGLSPKAFRNLRQTSADGTSQSEIKQLMSTLSDNVRANGGKNFVYYSGSADHVTQLPFLNSPHNKLMSVFSPIERNPGSTYNRSVAGILNTDINKTAKDIIKAFGAEHQYGSAVAFQGYSVDPDKLVDTNRGQANLMDILANVFGVDTSTGDGYGLANRAITNQIRTEGDISLTLKQTASNKYIIANEAMRQYVSGQISYDELKEAGLKGSTRFTKTVEKSLTKAQQRLSALNVAVDSGNAEEVFNYLKAEHKTFGKYKSYSDFVKANKKLDKATDKFKFMKNLASKSVLGHALEQSSFYAESFKDSVHENVVKRLNVVDEKLVLLQKAVSTSDFKGAQGIIDDLIQHNEEAKGSRSAYHAMYPQSGSRLGNNADLSEVNLKESYRYLEFDGAVKVLHQSDGGTKEAIQFMYKGYNLAGYEEISKFFGIASKEQVKHLDEETFSRFGFLHMMGKEGKLTMHNGAFQIALENQKPFLIRQRQLRAADFIGELKKAGVADKSIAFVQSKLDFFKGVGTISEDSGSGMKAGEKLANTLLKFNSKDPEVTEDTVRKLINSTTLGDAVLSKIKSGKLSENQIKGLSNAVISLSSDRATADYLLTTATSIKTTASYKVSQYTDAIGTPNEKAALAELNSFAKDLLGSSWNSRRKFNVTAFTNAVDNKVASLGANFRSADSVLEVMTNPNQLNSVLDTFMVERSHRLDSIGDTIIKTAAPNRRTEQETGAGKEGKSMSWNSQTQLKMNGFTDEELGFFGKFNVKNVADLQGVMSLRLKDIASVNESINESNMNQFLGALGTSISKRREELEKAGIKIDDVVGAYKIQTKNKFDFTHVPIMLEDTALFGSYTDSEGNLRDKNLNTTIAEIIQTDLKLQDKGLLQSQRDAETTKLNDRLEHLANTLRPSIGGQDNILKKALAREGTNSRYSTMVPIGGLVNNKAKTGESLVAVSSEGLLKRFKQLGFDYKNIDELRSDHLVKVNNKGLYKVMIDKSNDVPLFGIINREPATGPGSARFVEYYLDTTLKSDDRSLHIGRDDRLYKYFQFGDFDLDHTLEYMPDYKSKNYNPEAFKEMLNKGQSINRQLTDEDFLKYADLLGVKGSGKDKIKSLFDVYEEYGHTFKSTADWHDKYTEELMLSRQKAGDRKSISPTVTKLSADINDAISRSGGDSGTAMRARVLSHYFVENLLKSQHIENKKYKETPVSTAEMLSKYLYEYQTKDKFNQEFSNYIEQTVIKNIKQKEGLSAESRKLLIEQTDQAVKLIQESIKNNYDQKRGPLTPMHQKAPPNAMKVGEGVDGLIKNTYGAAANVPILNISEELIHEGNDLSLAQRGKLGYHKALEFMKHNLSNNKKLLMGAGAAFAGAALLTQSKPDFGDSRAEANPSGMLMAPAKSAIEDTARETGTHASLNRAIEYIRPYKKDNSYVGIQATPMDSNRNLNEDMDHFIFGDGLSSVRITNQINGT